MPFTASAVGTPVHLKPVLDGRPEMCAAAQDCPQSKGMMANGCSGSLTGLFFISQGMSMVATTPLERHYAPKDFADRVAYADELA